MSILLDTSAGEIVVDLLTEEAPIACKNFLKLCKIKYYNGCLVYNIQSNYILQTGDPTATGKGGLSIFGILENDPSICFKDEINRLRKINKLGLVCMAHQKENTNTSQFFITLRGEDMDHLNGKYTIFGEVAEGLDVLDKLNTLYCDEEGRPYQDVRIKHTFILDDPFPDPSNLRVPPESPPYVIPREEKVKQRISYEEDLNVLDEKLGRTEEEIEANIKKKEAYSRALVLEMVGDLPDVDAKPPKEVIFVCKLNPVTTDADLELIFSRFGTIKECEIIRDFKTGDSLNYAFIEFETEDACIEAYEKMNNVLIDDRRIKVDFSQSVSKLWNKYLLRPRKEMKQNRVVDTAISHYQQKPSQPSQPLQRMQPSLPSRNEPTRKPQSEYRQRGTEDRTRDSRRRSRSRSQDKHRHDRHRDDRHRDDRHRDDRHRDDSFKGDRHRDDRHRDDRHRDERNRDDRHRDDRHRDDKYSYDRRQDDRKRDDRHYGSERR